MKHRTHIMKTSLLLAALSLACSLVVAAQQNPVKVYILAGQSNMVGIGALDSGGRSWRKLVSDPVLSVYPGPYDASVDYDKLEPTRTQPVEDFGSNTAFPGEGVHVVRGFIKVKKTGLYQFAPGYGSSKQNITFIDGKEVHRREPGQTESQWTPIKLEGKAKTPFKTIYLNERGGSAGYYKRLDVPGTLTSVVKRQGKYPDLLDESGDWASRDDVWYKGVVTATADKWLSVGCGASKHNVGPELGFGWVIGNYHEEPVLIIKASQGNRSLGWDFLPPGSERFEYTDDEGTTWVYAGYKDPKSRWEKGTDPEKGGWYAGKQYDDCFDAAKNVLANFDENFPMWKDRKYEIAGFVWWQGHKDSGNKVHRQRYEQNLVQLINQLRKEFDAPKAPFVVATIGFHGWDMPEQYVPIAEAQLAVDGDNGNYPAFEGNVNTVETRDFWKPASESPRGQDFHYNQNGETYYLIGRAIGEGMIELLKESNRELAENMVAEMPADYDEMPDSAYYKVRPIFNPYPSPGKDWEIKDFGPVGISITLSKPAFTMKIRHVEEGSPAAATGKLKKGQIIESINGKTLQDIDPRIILGNIITKAEATDGLIKLAIKDEGVVTVKIPVLGAYSDTWPMNCEKSDKIVRNLANTLAKQEAPRWGSVLFLLSTGNEKDLDVVRKWMAHKEKIGNGVYAWHAGYIGIGVCEYYLRTGDESVLPMITEMAESLRKLMYNGGWSGRPGAQFTYSTGSGQMHAAGVHALSFLLLAKMCGVDVDEYTLQQSLKAFYRFAGHENVPYGDGWPEGGFRDNGKTAGLAVAMAAAARLTPDGEDSVYADARDVSAMKSFYATSWFHAAHTGGGIGEIWHHAAMSMMHDRRPVQYRSFFDTRRWVMELSRRHDGSIGIAGFKDRYDQSATEHQRSWGTYFALTYTIPRQQLQLFGAPKTKWCKSYQLPDRPWGRPADDAFVSPAPPDNASIGWQDLHSETVRKDASLPFLIKTRPDDITDETLLFYLQHPESGIRTATMRRVVDKKRDHLIVPMLKSSDPRVRHSALLAIKGMFKGNALPDERVTPEMFAQVSNLIEDPDESLWVVMEAMKAISRAPREVIAKHRDTLLKYLANDSWFVRDAAVSALAPICTEREHYKVILPLMIDTLAGFTTDAPASASTKRLAKQLREAQPEVQAFASDILREAYEAVPPQMRFPGGYVVPNGANIIRSKLGGLVRLLPGGEDYIKTRPMMTLAAGRSGKAEDKYRYSGTHTPNKQALGTWSTLWPRPKSPEDFEGKMRGYVKKYDEPPSKPKDTMTLLEGGKVKSNRFKGCFWSDDWLLDPRHQVARKMIFRTFEDVDFIFVEMGGFEKADGSEDWYPGYYPYARRSDLESPDRPKTE